MTGERLWHVEAIAHRRGREGVKVRGPFLQSTVRGRVGGLHDKCMDRTYRLAVKYLRRAIIRPFAQATTLPLALGIGRLNAVNFCHHGHGFCR